MTHTINIRDSKEVDIQPGNMDTKMIDRQSKSKLIRIEGSFHLANFQFLIWGSFGILSLRHLVYVSDLET
jgi:hypothetical protein